MSSAASSGPGRPPGRDSETLERARRIQAYEREGLKHSEIAELEGISVSYVKLLKRAPLDQVSPVRARKPPPLRLSERALTHHAVLAMRRDTRLRAFDPGKKLFWLDCVMEIHALGDADGLTFGSDGDAFETHLDFAIALGGKPDDLEHFLRRGLLTRLPDGGIDLPVKIGLKPKERPRVMLPGSGEQFLAQAFDPLGDSEIGDRENPPISLSERTGKTPQFHYPSDSEIPPISLSAAGVAPAAAATAYAEDSQSLSSSSSKGSRADGGDSEIRQFHYPSDSEIGDSEIAGSVSHAASLALKGKPINPKRSELGALTEELAALAGLRRPANPDDLGVVQGWLDEGYSADTMRAVIEAGMRRRNGRPPTALRYFQNPMRETRQGARLATSPVIAVPQTDPPAPLSDADKALKDELQALWQRAHTDRKSRLPPVFSVYQAKACNGHEAPARRWLNVYTGCLAADSLGDLPEFAAYLQAPALYEARMAEIEEELTAPDPPEAAE